MNPNNEIDLENKEIDVYAGIDNEYIPFGRFIIEKPNNKEVVEKTSFTGYDYMIKFNKTYEDNNTYPISLKDYLSNLCNQVGIELGSQNIVNGNYMINGNSFNNNEDCKTVLSSIAQLCGGFARIGRDNKLYIITLSKSEAVDTIDGNNYDTSFAKNKMYGEVNSLIIRLSTVEGENTTREDEQSVSENGLTEITIADNYILTDSTQRELVIDQIWNALKGVKYLPFTTDYYGYPYLDAGDKINILDNNDVVYSSYVLNHTFKFNGAFSGKIETKALTKTQTAYKNINSIRNKFKNVEIIVDKQNQKIQAVAEQTTEIQGKFNETVKNVDVLYALGTSETTAPTTGWSTTAPKWESGKYMWQKTITTYTNDNTSESNPTCISGAKGDKGNAGTSISINSTSITYQVSTDGKNTPTGTWLNTIPDVPKGQYLWTRTVVIYSDNTSTTAYSVAYKGTDGQKGENGNDGTSMYTHIRYSASSDGSNFVTTPTASTIYIGVYNGTSSTAPTNKSLYVWSKYKGDKGDKGDTGNAGSNGNGINSITYYYKTTTTQTAPSASSITSTTIPTLSATNKYLWQKEVIDFTDSNVADKTSVILLAVYGDKGDKGNDGAKGDTGIGIDDIVEQYYLSTSNTTQTGGTWKNTQDEWSEGHYIWTRSKVTWTDGDITYTDPVLATGLNGALEGVNNIINTQAIKEGTTIEIDDSAEEPILEFEADGHSEQATRSGKNLLIDDYKMEPYGTTPPTITELTGQDTPKGLGIVRKIIFPANNDATFYTGCRAQSTMVTILDDGNNNFTVSYRVWVKTLMEYSTDYTIYVTGTMGTKNAIRNKKYDYGEWQCYEINNFKYTMPSYSSIYEYITIYAKSTSTKERTIEVAEAQINDGALVEWEQYGASPSSEFPSPIISKGESWNKFDKNGITKTSGVSKTVLETGIRVNQLTAGQYRYLAIELGKEELLGRTLTLSSIISSSSQNKGAVLLYFGNAENVAVKNADLSISSNGFHKITKLLPTSFPNNCDRIWLLLYANQDGTGNTGDYVDYTDLMVYEGTEEKPYRDFGYNLFIEKKSKNEFDDNKAYDLIKLTYSNGIYSASDNDTRSSLQYKIQQYNNSTFLGADSQVTKVIASPGKYYFTSTKVENANNLRIANAGTTSEFNLRYPLDNIAVGEKFTVVIDVIDVTIGASKFKDVMLLKGEITEADYEPYFYKTYTIPLNKPLRGLPNGVKDDLRTTRIKSVILDGSDDENWVLGVQFLPENGRRFDCNLTNYPKAKSNQVLCSHFKYNGPNLGGCWANSEGAALSNLQLRIQDDKFENVEELKQWLQQNPIEVIYELAEPIEEELTEEQQEVIQSIETNLYTQYFSSDANMRIKYVRNNGLTDLYETKNNAERNYTETERKISDLNIDVHAITATVGEVTTRLDNDYMTTDQIEAETGTLKEDINIIKKQQASMELTSTGLQVQIDTINNEGVKTVKNTTVDINEAGVTVGKSDSEFSTTMSNTGTYMYSYDKQIAKYDKDGAKMYNLTVENEAIIGNLRALSVEVEGEKRTHIHWIGG